MRIEIDREEDGRWIAEIPELPGVMVYADTRKQAISKAEALALRVKGPTVAGCKLQVTGKGRTAECR